MPAANDNAEGAKWPRDASKAPLTIAVVVPPQIVVENMAQVAEVFRQKHGGKGIRLMTMITSQPLLDIEHESQRGKRARLDIEDMPLREADLA